MKRLLALLCVFALTGCSAWGGGKNTSPSSLENRPIATVEGSSSSGDLEIYDPWGIVLSVKDVTTGGATLVCAQSGGEDVNSLFTGAPYVLEQLHGDHWHECETMMKDVDWTDEAWIIELDSTTEWEIDWTSLYGKLDAGTYRIGKTIYNSHESGVHDKTTYYAEFIIL